ncbi:DMT family transporter [Paenirhodobacter sp.]|uniref:DMT family transporter n=1 Tax=Paenirhodobacter sp. TaxID=1965326 RepID=UPI003B426762
MTPDAPPSTATGIALKLASVVAFTVMAAMLKSVSGRVPPGEMVFFRSAFGILPIVIWLAVTHELSGGMRVQKPFAHILRGVIGTTSMALGFAALAYLPLPEATAIGYAAPILTVIFAALLLGERVRLVRSSAVVLGMVGVLIVLWPQIGGHAGRSEMIGAALALGGACCTGLVMIQIRRMVATERTSAIVFWFSLTATMMALFTLPFGWVMPTAREAMLLIGAGLIGGTSQILMTAAYRHADASVVAPFEYASIVVALILGYTVFGQTPAVTTLIGAAVVIAAGVLIIWREGQLGLERRQRKATTPHG